MNKYHKALNSVIPRYCNNCFVMFESEVCKKKLCYKPIESLKELVDKATPKKPIAIADNFGYTMCCPNCKRPIVNVYTKADYKPEHHDCGQALDWGKQNG